MSFRFFLWFFVTFIIAVTLPIDYFYYTTGTSYFLLVRCHSYIHSLALLIKVGLYNSIKLRLYLILQCLVFQYLHDSWEISI